MIRATATIARYALLESARGALPWLALAGLALSLALSAFLSEVAITEANALRVSAGAAFLRVCVMFLVCAQVVSSVVRESNDKGLELVLALPISRPVWYLGKLAGFAAMAAAIATALALPLLWSAPATHWLGWWLALAGEAVLMAAAALFFATALGQTVAAIAACAGLYVLARSIGAIQAIASSPLVAEGSVPGAARGLADVIALLLPRLDAVARGDWLLYGPPSGAEFARMLAGLAIYAVLLAAAGLFDASRRNL